MSLVNQSIIKHKIGLLNLVAEEGCVLTEAQVALARKREEQLECGEIETAHPGYLRSQDTFYARSGMRAASGAGVGALVRARSQALDRLVGL